MANIFSSAWPQKWSEVKIKLKYEALFSFIRPPRSENKSVAYKLSGNGSKVITGQLIRELMTQRFVKDWKLKQKPKKKNK